MSRNKRDITFATFNLYNLQLPGVAMYPRSRPYTETQYRAKIAWTAQSLRRLDADIIAFQELWSRQCLEDAFTAADLADDYELAFIKDGDWDGIAVAAAVRKPWSVLEVTRHKAFPDTLVLKKRKKSMRDIQANPTAADMEVDPLLLPSHEDDEIEVAITEFSRSPIQVRVAHTTADDVPELEVFCAHLKSKLPSRLDIEEFRDDNIRVHASAIGAAISTIRRTAEAAALRIILNNVMKNTHKPTVLLGDFNDAQLSNTLGILSDQPSYRLYSDSTAAQRNDDGLFTAATLHQLRNIRDHAYSHEFKGVREVIDHVLVSEQFYDFSENRRWSFHEMKIWNDHVEDDAPETSDHGIVRAEFDWNPAR